MDYYLYQLTILSWLHLNYCVKTIVSDGNDKIILKEKLIEENKLNGGNLNE